MWGVRRGEQERPRDPNRGARSRSGRRERPGTAGCGRREHECIYSRSEDHMNEHSAIDPRVDIGHVHLKVSDIELALGFYRDVLGFEVMQRMGEGAVFLSAGGYHHHLGLNTWESRGGSPPPRGSTGLYHVAIRYPDRRSLADALLRLRGAGIPLEGAADHGVSEALYLQDPDGNGVELYWDRPREVWPREEDGGLRMHTRPLDLVGLAAEAEPREEP
jgi:catechol 2,3-dioxygenase